MATTGIIIYENDRYILKTLTERLKSKLPDVYITDGTDREHTREITRLCDECMVIYDARQFDKGFSKNKESMAIFENGFVDTKTLIKPIRIEGPMEEYGRQKGFITLLVSTVYTTDRERYITNELKDVLDCEECIRLDLISDLGSSDKPTGALEKLIESAAKRNFASTSIMDYCLLNDRGFFTPGSFLYEHDPNDYKPEKYGKLMQKLDHLVKKYGRRINGLIVAEPLRPEIMAALAGKADRIILLLPDNRELDGEGTKNLIAGLSRAAQGIDVEVKTLDALAGERNG
ncbi:hypothetical protein SAMN02910456_00022 [Ruminococcaceae bacterium YRB3002]|nr:hypothetical protein SAMN02910456_00022 [Ruminococcaceae bacterium YRB3002]